MAHTSKRCKHCKKRASVKTGLQCPAGFFCSTSHAIEFARNAQKRARDKAIEKEARLHQLKIKTAHKAAKESKRTDLKWQHRLTQKSFNKMRVLEELAWFKKRKLIATCISCNKPKGGDEWACGHFKTRGSNGALRYDRNNTFLQHNHRCNMHLSGDIAGTKHTRGFKQGLIDRFGEEQGLSIIKHCEADHKARKWAWQELEALRSEFNQTIRSIKNLLNNI